MQSCLDFSLIQLVTHPTRSSATSANILDLLLTNDPEVCSDLTHQDGLSDHDIVIGSLTLSFPGRQCSDKYIRCYNKANFNSINSELYVFSLDFLNNYQSQTIEHNWLMFKTTLTDLINRLVPLTKIACTLTSPWFTIKLRRLNNKKKRLYRSADKDRLSDSWHRYKVCDKRYQSFLKSSK